MPNFGICIIAVLTAASAALPFCTLAAAPDRQALTQLGENALAARDIDQSAVFFERARTGTEGPEWRNLTLQLATIELERGQPAAAEKLLAEFAIRYPDDGRIARRILAAKVLLAKHNYSASDQAWTELLTKEKLTSEELGTVLSMQLRTRLAAGNYRDAIETAEKLEKLAPDPAAEFNARCGRAYAMAMSGNLADSAALIKKISVRNEAEKTVVGKLELLQLLLEKKDADFLRKYIAFTAAGVPDRADPLFFRLATIAGRKYRDVKEFKESARFFRDAFAAASTDGEKREMLRELINVRIAANEAAAGAEAIGKYLEFYPDSPEKTTLLLQAARLWEQAGNPDAAIRAYGEITSQDKVPLQTRLETAREAALAAVRLNRPAAVRQNLRYIIERAEKPELRQDAFFLLGEADYRQGEYARAAENFGSAAAETGKLAERARFWQLQSFVKAGADRKAAETAKALLGAKDPELRAAANYFEALLLDRAGKLAEARIAYRTFAKSYPGTEFTPAALFAAARLAMEAKDYPESGQLFRQFADQYPAHELAANALWRAAQSAFLIPDDDAMRAAAETLTTRYPASPYTVAVLFRQADYLRTEARYPAALKVLEDIAALAEKNSNGEVAARCLYDQAEIYARLDNSTKALALLAELQTKFVNSPVAADAALLAGNLQSNLADYPAAIASYRRAAELRPGGVFGAVALERLADSEFSEGLRTRNPENLTRAEAIYRQLVEKNEGAAVYSAGFKLGRTLEEEKKTRSALTVYKELLYRALTAREKGETIEPIWVSKAAYAAINLNLRKNNPNAAREALRLIELVKALKLQSSEDFDRIAEEILNKYRI